ncbi:MAG: segregation/condensation protein A [Anaerovoracaceae bacterium]
MGYKVKLNIFEGPFDLLVYLIENAQMSIYDIQISKIIKQYLEYMGQMKEMDVSVASEFMVLATALMEIKSKMLLPGGPIDGDDGLLEDPRTELVERLLEYKRFKMLSQLFADREEAGLSILTKPQEDISIYTNEPDEYLSLDIGQFVKAFDLFLGKKKKMEEIQKHHRRTEKQRVTTETRIEDIRQFFVNYPKEEVNFRKLVKKNEDKYDVALTFSSLLEMMKTKAVEAEQEYTYGDILVKAANQVTSGEKIKEES